MKIIIHNVKSDKLEFWEVPNPDKFKKTMSVDSPELDFYQVLDFTKQIKGSGFEVVRNEIITSETYLEETKTKGEVLPWYMHSEEVRKLIYNDEELSTVRFILDTYGQAVWSEIEKGIIPKPDGYPTILAKARKTIKFISKKRELQRIRVKEV
jgi:hypothetical protein